MITYPLFKQIFNQLNPNHETEIEIFFANKKCSYMIIKYSDHISFQRCGTILEQSGEINFSSLDELASTTTIDDINLQNDWLHIKDIIFDSAFSIVEDQKEFLEFYAINL